MAGKSTSGEKKHGWRTKWPRSNDITKWIQCGVEKAGHLADPNDQVSEAAFFLETLAEIGQKEEALRYLDRLLRRHAKTQDAVLALEAAAKIAIKLGDLSRVDAYMERIAACQPLFKRPCDRDYCQHVIRDFKADHGLLDPSQAEDDRQRIEASFNWDMRLVDECLKQGRKRDALEKLRSAERFVPDMEAWRQTYAAMDLVDRYLQLKDLKSVRRWVRRMGKRDLLDRFDSRKLWEIGFKKESLAQVRAAIENALEELASDDLNVHFPAFAIEAELLFLVQVGQKKLARKWLRRVLDEGKKWQLKWRGTATSAVFRCMAKAVAAIEGPAAAESLLQMAMQDAQGEHRPGWKRAAIAETVELHATIGGMDQAVELARKMRSPTARRSTLTNLLTQAGRWKELREVLCQCATPKEACELCWDVTRTLRDMRWDAGRAALPAPSRATN